MKRRDKFSWAKAVNVMRVDAHAISMLQQPSPSE